jgi:Protein of unknown function (DUF3726)
MIYSENEISSLFKKAGLGAGLPTGLAEDTSRAGLWLLGQGVSGEEAVLKGISSLNMYNSKIHFNDQTEEIDNVCAALHGPSLFDLAAAKVDVFQVHLLHVDCGLLLIGLAGIALADYGLETEIKFSDDSKIETGSTGLDLSGLSVPDDASNIRLTCRHIKLSDNIRAEQHSTYELKEAVTKELLMLAAKTYVPATKASREKGAGAGLTDND